MSKLVLHVGAAKCGSSALQTALSLNSDLDHQSGKKVVYAALTDKGQVISKFDLRRRAVSTVADYVASPSSYVLTQMSQSVQATAVKNLNRMLDEYDLVILSHESWFYTVDALGGLDLFSNLKAEVEILGFVRPQTQVLNSAWWQWGAWTDVPIDTWISRHSLPSLNWGHFAQKWKDLDWVDEVTLIPLKGDIVERFCAHLDIQCPDTKPSNASLGSDALRLFQRNRELRPTEHASSIDFVLSRLAPGTGTPWVISKDWIEHAIEVCRAGNVAMQKFMSAQDWKSVRGNQKWWDARAFDDVQVQSVDPPAPDLDGLEALCVSLAKSCLSLEKRLRVKQAEEATNPVALMQPAIPKDHVAPDRTIYLHVGMHKTGTTAIQTALANYEDARIRYAQLGNPNHSFWMHDAYLRPGGQKMRQLGYTGAHRETHIAASIRARTQLLDELKNNTKDLIISGEGLGNLTHDEVDDLKGLLQPFASKIQLIAFVREPVSFVASAVQQRLKSMNITTFPRSIYGSRLRAFVDVFGDESFIFREYQKEQLRNGSSIAEFCSIVGIPDQKVKDRQANGSLAMQTVKLMYVLAADITPVEKTKANVMAWRNVNSFLGQVFTEKFMLPPDLAATIYDKKDLDWIRSVSGLDLSPDRENTLPEAGLCDMAGFLSDISSDALDRLRREMERQQIPLPKGASPLQAMHSLFGYFRAKHQTKVKNLATGSA